MSSKSLRNSRRRFLKGVAATGGGAVLVGAAGGTQAESRAHDDRDEPVRETQGYRETAHVREYYEKARF